MFKCVDSFFDMFHADYMRCFWVLALLFQVPCILMFQLDKMLILFKRIATKWCFLVVVGKKDGDDERLKFNEVNA